MMPQSYRTCRHKKEGEDAPIPADTCTLDQAADSLCCTPAGFNTQIERKGGQHKGFSRQTNGGVDAQIQPQDTLSPSHTHKPHYTR